MKFTYDVLTEETAHEVSSVIKNVYGKSYSELALPTAEQAWTDHEKGDNIVVLAFYEGKAEGLVTLKRSPDNKRVYELGMLSVSEFFRSGEMAGGLLEFVKGYFPGRLAYDAVYMENVSEHYYSQRKAYYNGSVDSAIMLSAMPGLSCEHKRLSFITGFVENAEPPIPTVHMPRRYADNVLFFYQGLRQRSFFPLAEDVPDRGSTLSRKREFPTLGLLKDSITDIGADFASYVDTLSLYAQEKSFVTVQVFLPMSSKHLSFATDILHEKGWFIGGVMPFWFGADGFLMQKISDKDLSDIKIYSKKAKKLMEIIKKDKV